MKKTALSAVFFVRREGRPSGRDVAVPQFYVCEGAAKLPKCLTLTCHEIGNITFRNMKSLIILNIYPSCHVP